MKFPPFEVLPPLSSPELRDWSYPAYEGRPYTKEFANHLIDLIDVEDRLWRHLKHVKAQNGYADVYFDLFDFGKLSLPRWSFKMGGQSFTAETKESTLLVQVDKTARLYSHPEATTYAAFDGDWSSRTSDFGAMVRHMLPYTRQISLATSDNDNIDLNPPLLSA